MEKSSFKKTMQDDREVRVTTTDGYRRASLSKKSTNSKFRNATQGVVSRDSLGRRSGMTGNSKSKGSHNSKSPDTRKVMETLTHHRVAIDEKTQLLINGSEVLSEKGISGKIHKVGVGFGTGRHTSGIRLDLLKEAPLELKREPERSGSMMTIPTAPVIPVPERPASPEKVDAGI